MATTGNFKIWLVLGAAAALGACEIMERNAACGSYSGSKSACERYSNDYSRRQAEKQAVRDMQYRRDQEAKRYQERRARKAKRDKERANKYLKDLQKQKIPTAEELRKTAKEIDAECRKKPACRHYSEGKRLYNAKRYREAIGEFAKSARADRNYEIAYVMWGMALTRTGKAHEAVRRIDNGIAAAKRKGRTGSWYWWPYFHKGVALMATRNAPAARTAFSESIRLSPRSATYEARGRTYATEKKYAMANADFDRALKGNSRNSRVWSSKAQVLFMSGSTGSGCKAAKKACGLGDCRILKKVPQCGR